MRCLFFPLHEMPSWFKICSTHGLVWFVVGMPTLPRYNAWGLVAEAEDNGNDEVPCMRHHSK